MIFFHASLSADITPPASGWQILVDNQVIFHTDMVGGSTFTRVPGLFSHNWVLPALSPGSHVVQVQWKAGPGVPGEPQGEVLGSALIVQHGP